jgi:cell division protein FtsQ
LGISETDQRSPAEAKPERVLPRRPRRRLLVVAGVAAGLVAVAASGWWISTSSIFRLRTFTVHGTRHTTPTELEHMAGVNDRTNVVWADLPAIEARLRSNPWVLEARVQRKLPSTLLVTVVERRPVARGGQPELLLAADGTVLGPAGSRSRLPEVQVTGSFRVGQRVQGMDASLVRVAGALVAQLPGQIQRVEAGAAGEVQVVLTDGIPVRFGDASQAEAKARALAAIVAWSVRNGVRPVYFDVSAPAAPALLPVGADAHPSPSPSVAAPKHGRTHPSPSASPSPSA